MNIINYLIPKSKTSKSLKASPSPSPTATSSSSPASSLINPSSNSNPSTNDSPTCSEASKSLSFSSKTSLSSLKDSLPENPHIYDFSEICKTTGNFLKKPFSSSSSSTSWRCSIRGKEVIIFQRKFRRHIGLPELQKKLLTICRSHHSSVIKLLGVSSPGNYIYLVYEYVHGANLATCLRNPQNSSYTVLSSWLSRMQIATDIAHGLDYIHHCSGLNSEFVHGRIKSSSILVTEDSLNAKICHFGTAELCGEMVGNESSLSKNFGRSDSREMKFEGTTGYMAPEFQASGFVTQRGKVKVNIVEPKFRMSLAELLDESKVVPVSVLGDLEVEITGIQDDSRVVSAGDLFVCRVGMKTDGHLYLSEADKRGAVAVVASKEVDIEETLGCKALVIVEDTNAVLPALAAAFYKFPSKNMAVIGITGTNGKTTTANLVKGMYEAMGLRTGMLSTVAYYIHGDHKLEAPNTTPGAILVQNLMAKMLHNGTEAVVMEATSQGLALGRCDEVDFDIAVFTNLTRDHLDFHGTEEEYKNAKAKLFARMVDPERHRKVVNIDDPNAPFFIAQGNQEVPVVTFAMENKNADVHPLKFELSLFETQVLVNTPHGILEISSGLLGKHNIYNILAAVAVGIAVGAPLEDIVRGIEEIDAVPGRCELIDEEQAFGVIVDYAHTPDALSRLLDSVRELRPKRIITVIGCGGERDRGKRPIMTKIATDKSDVTILTSDNPRGEDPLDILDDMLAGVGWSMQEYLKHGENDYYPPLPNGHRLFLHDIRRVAVRCAVAMGEEGDMVVVAGKGHETYEIEGDKKEFFDDREECREALQYVDELHQAGIDTSEFPWRLPESH